MAEAVPNLKRRGFEWREKGGARSARKSAAVQSVLTDDRVGQATEGQLRMGCLQILYLLTRDMVSTKYWKDSKHIKLYQCQGTYC